MATTLQSQQTFRILETSVSSIVRGGLKIVEVIIRLIIAIFSIIFGFLGLPFGV
jgi:hypothetical protein